MGLVLWERLGQALCILSLSMSALWAQPKMYWTDSDRPDIRRANLDGSQNEAVLSTVSMPLCIELDLGNEQMYWIDRDSHKLMRSTLDGTQLQEIVQVYSEGLALDLTAGKVYWTDYQDDVIRRANLDGTEVEDLVTTGLLFPGTIALDLTGGKMYWVDLATRKLQRANLDGSEVEDLILNATAFSGYIGVDPAAGKLYWGTDGSLRRANLDGSEVEVLISGDLFFPSALRLDVAHGKIYLADIVSTSISRINLDGSGSETIIGTEGNIYGIALDHTGSRIYWTQAEVIRRGAFDGSNVEDVLTRDLRNPYGIAIDVDSGKLYWTDRGADKIQRSNLDGSEKEDLVTTGLVAPNDLALDRLGGKLYWVDASTHKIQRSNLDGSNVEDLVHTVSQPIGLALDLPRNKMYWSHPGGGSIYRSDLEGTQITLFLNDAEATYLAMDPRGGTLYWISQSRGTINRINVDGTNRKVLVSNLTSPLDLALDVPGGKVYWAEQLAHTINRANLDGSEIEVLVVDRHGSTSQLALTVTNPLPVELTSFSTQVSAATAHLFWQTASETNNAGFEVQHRTANPDPWQPVTFIPGAGTTTEAQHYSHQINDLSPGRHLFRLKQIDFDGTTAYHGPTEAVIEVPGSHVLSEAYPNPFHASTRFTLTLAREQVVRITLWDATGRLAEVLHEGRLPARQSQVFQIDGTDLASGIYHYRIEGEAFVESRSVMLLR